MVIWLSNCTGKEEEFVLSSNSVTVAQSFPVAAMPSPQINNNDDLKCSRRFAMRRDTRVTRNERDLRGGCRVLRTQPATSSVTSFVT
jgi:hypothetical protein